VHVPIPKHSDFRPISLLSIVAKIMGKVVVRRVSFLAERTLVLGLSGCFPQPALQC
jgi:hypothetical protein